ncbi:hypothetical protein ACC848_37735, partial [Rhizobium johnstonii]
DGADITVLLPRPEGAVRQILANLLEQVATTESDLSVRLSASVGWAGVDVVGYDLDALVAEASDAASLARHAGASVAQLEELISIGVVAPDTRGRFDARALGTVTLALRAHRLGIPLRNLRPVRTAA